MENIFKSAGVPVRDAQAKAAPEGPTAEDMARINRWAKGNLTAEDVYTFPVNMCDNEVDRDTERFPDTTLEALAPMFEGKPVLTDHRWSAEKQAARLYRTRVLDTGERNSLGEPYRVLRGDAYMLKNDQTAPMIDAIEGGILREVSVGFAAKKRTCSLCGKRLFFDWKTWTDHCEDGHALGETYDGRLCFAELSEPTDAYELSFVAVPAQPGAAVTAGKSAADVREAFRTLQEADLTGYEKSAVRLSKRLQAAFLEAGERQERAKILQENQKYLKNPKKENEENA